MQEFARDVESQMGPADILINNAGICLIPQTFEETPDEQFVKVIDVNMWGAYYGIRAFLPQLKTRPEASIVNISSLAGLVGLYGHAAYSMSKSALRGLSEAMQAELSGTQVHLLLVHPGGVQTNLIKNAPNLDKGLQEKAHKNFTELSFLTPEKTVSRLIKGIQNKKNRVIIGLDARLILILRALFPRRFPNIIRTVFSQANFKDDPVWKTPK
jgi:short-subunit dehydrogenase